MTRQAFLILAAAGGLVLGGCASDGASGGAHKTADRAATKSWRMVTQVENRFAVFINEPGAPRDGDLVTFRLAYVYAPGEVRYNDEVVGWQEYAAMQINCSANEMKPGPRVRYAPDGKIMLSDDSQEFGPINEGTAAADAARVRCSPDAKADAAPDVVRIPDGAKWMDRAREHLAATPVESAAR